MNPERQSRPVGPGGTAGRDGPADPSRGERQAHEAQPPRTLVVATIMERTAAEIDAAIEEAALVGADAAEVRLDAAPGVEPGSIGAKSPIPLIAACRSRRDGGAFDGAEPARVERLERAEATGRFRLDVEQGSAAERIQRERPGSVAVLSRHDHAATPEDLDSIARALVAATRPGQVAKLVTTATRAGDVLRLRETLDRFGAMSARRHRAAQVVASGNGHPSPGHGRLAAFAMGEPGLASRILAGVWGSGAIWAAARPESPGAPGQIGLQELLELYRFRSLGPETRLFAVAGSPIGGSVSPVLHNTAFAHLGIDAAYLPLACRDAQELFELARELPLAGVSVTAPLKVAVLPRLTKADPSVTRAGACNTLLLRDPEPENEGSEDDRGEVLGFNTDGPAALEEIRAHVEVAGCRALVIGAGGAARAIAFALAEAGARVSIANRGAERGEALARALGVDRLSLENIDADPGRILVHATSAPLDDPIVPPRALAAAFVLDVRYGGDIALVRAARGAGTPAADGLGMLVRQAHAQIRLFTGSAVPIELLFGAARGVAEGR